MRRAPLRWASSTCSPSRARRSTEALSLAQQVCANAPVSVQACLAAVNDLVAAADDEQGWEQTGLALRAAAGSDDAREGVAAFLEKRAPVWTGR